MCLQWNFPKKNFASGKVGDRTLCSVSPHLNKQTDLPFKRERDFVSLHKDGNITIQNQQIPQKLVNI